MRAVAVEAGHYWRQLCDLPEGTPRMPRPRLGDHGELTSLALAWGGALDWSIPPALRLMGLFRIRTGQVRPVVVDLFARVSEGDVRSLRELITVPPGDRGPRSTDVTQLASGASAYRSIGALPAVPDEDGTALAVFLLFHAWCAEGFDFVSRTCLGTDPSVLPGVLPTLENTLATVSVVDGGSR